MRYLPAPRHLLGQMLPHLFVPGVVIFLLFTAVFVWPEQFEQCPRWGKQHHCVDDGDTIWFHGEKIRLFGFDTPEVENAKCENERKIALQAKAKLIDLLNDGRVTVTRRGIDRQKRTIATVQVNGKDVGPTLIALGLAFPYFGKARGRNPWCGPKPPST